MSAAFPFVKTGPSLRRATLFFVRMTFATLAAGCSDRLPSDPAITIVAPLPDPIGYAGMAAGVSSGVVYAGGGAHFPGKMPWEGGAKHFSRRVYALRDGVWTTAGEWPRALAYAASAGTPEGLVVAGGCDERVCFRDVFLWRPDGATGVAAALPALPAPVAFAAYAVCGDRLIVAGGLDSPASTRASDAVYALDLRAPAKGWETLPPPPGAGRILAVAGTMAGRFYLMGGVALAPGPTGTPVRTYLRDVVSYDPATRTWRRGHDLPTLLAAGPGPAPVSGDAFVLAGGDTGAFFATGRPPSEHPGQPRDVRLFRPGDGATRDIGRLPTGVVTAPVVATGDGAALIVSGESAPGIRTPQVVRIGGR